VLRKSSVDVAKCQSQETANCYFNFSRFLYESVAYERSIENNEKSLVRRESILGDSHPKIAVTYHHIGMALDTKDGGVNEALTCMMKSVEREDQCPSIAGLQFYHLKSIFGTKKVSPNHVPPYVR